MLHLLLARDLVLRQDSGLETNELILSSCWSCSQPNCWAQVEENVSIGRLQETSEARQCIEWI